MQPWNLIRNWHILTHLKQEKETDISDQINPTWQISSSTIRKIIMNLQIIFSDSMENCNRNLRYVLQIDQNYFHFLTNFYKLIRYKNRCNNFRILNSTQYHDLGSLETAFPINSNPSINQNEMRAKNLMLKAMKAALPEAVSFATRQRIRGWEESRGERIRGEKNKSFEWIERKRWKKVQNRGLSFLYWPVSRREILHAAMQLSIS